MKTTPKTLLLICSIFVSLGAVIPSFGGIDDGLVAHYLFNGSADDAAGINDGILNGNASFTNGINELALSVAVTGDYVEIPANTNINLNGTNQTISVWFKPGQQTHGQAMICDKSSNSDYTLFVLTNSDPTIIEVRFRVYSSGGFENVTGFVPAGKWVHASVLKEGTNISLYTNAVLMGSMTASSIVTRNNVLIVGAGGSPYASGHQFVGAIEDLRFYNRALATNEIQQLYEWPFPTLTVTRSSVSNAFDIGWNAITGDNYQLQFNPTLDPSGWADVGSEILATNGTAGLSFSNSFPNTQGFFRVHFFP